MHFPAKCNSGRIALHWFHIKHYLDYQYTKFQPYTFRVQKMCVFARYATLVPRLVTLRTAIVRFKQCGKILCSFMAESVKFGFISCSLRKVECTCYATFILVHLCNGFVFVLIRVLLCSECNYICGIDFYENH